MVIGLVNTVFEVRSWIKLGLIFLLLCVGFVYTGPRAWHEFREKSPTVINVEDWPKTYDGQYWVEVRGIAKPDLTPKSPPSYTKAVLTYALVPIVGKGYRTGAPIHVIANIGPFADVKEGVFAAHLNGSAFAGTVGEQQNWRKLFPDLNVDESAVLINVGHEPASGSEWMFAAQCLLIAAIIALVVIRARRWRATQ